MAARLHHTHIFASDMDATLDFYRRWFGAEVLADHVFAGARNVMMKVGDGRINIYDQAPAGQGRNAVHHLGIQVDNLQTLVDTMSADGFDFRTPIRVLDELDYIMVEAPDGILLELFEFKGTTDQSAGLTEWFAW